MYVPLDDEYGTDPLDHVVERLEVAGRTARAPEAIVSKDQKVQLIVVQAPFPSASVSQGETLVALLEGILADV